jgi:rhodanese-related sulfurtransferase
LRLSIDAVSLPAVDSVPAAEALQAVRSGQAQVVDVRGSTAFRDGHLSGALWGIRPRLDRLGLDPALPVYLVGDEAAVTALVARDLGALGIAEVAAVAGGQAALAGAGAAVEAGPDRPSHEDAIDYLFFVHDRHDGNLESSRRYLAWEQGLIAQLDPAERAAFVLSDKVA